MPPHHVALPLLIDHGTAALRTGLKEHARCVVAWLVFSHEVDARGCQRLPGCLLFPCTGHPKLKDEPQLGSAALPDRDWNGNLQNRLEILSDTHVQLAPHDVAPNASTQVYTITLLQCWLQTGPSVAALWDE